MKKSYYNATAKIVPSWRRVTSAVITTGMVAGKREEMIMCTVGGEFARPSLWKEPPHVALANLDFPGMAGSKAALRFTKLYGPLSLDQDQMLAGGAGSRFAVIVTAFQAMQDALRQAWRQRDGKVLWFAEGFEELETYLLPMTFVRGSFELRPADFWTYLCQLTTRDLAEKRARICANPKCPAPFFVAKRNDQKFCEWKCANAAAQRNFRRRHGK